MKRRNLIVIIVFIVFLLGGCSNKVTQKDLKANAWLVSLSGDETDEQDMFIATFNDDKMEMSINTDSLYDTQSTDVYEQAGKDLMNQYIDSMKFSIDYTLKSDTIHLKSKDLDIDSDFSVKKEKSKIIFTNKKDSKSKLILETYNESKSTRSNETSNESAEESSSESSNSENPTATSNSYSDLNSTLKTDDFDITITDVEFLGNIDNSSKEIYDAEGLMVIYYTFKNNSNDNIESNFAVTDHLEISAEDDKSEDSLSPAFNLYQYQKYKDLDKESRLNIKPQVTIDGAIDYLILDKTKSINMKLVRDTLEENEDNIVFQKSFSSKDIETSMKKNSAIKPE